MGILPAAAGITDLLVSHRLGSRPIFFVAHSLGGIVVKSALRQCADSSDPRKNAIFNSTQGIVLFGTPNSGASMGNVCAFIPGFASMQAAELARADTLLLDIGQWFRGKAGVEKIRCHCFYETERLNGQIIVDAASANPGVDGCDPSPLTENHVNMPKIPSVDHSAFGSVAEFISSTCRDRTISTGRDASSPSIAEITPKLRPEYVTNLFTSHDMRHLYVPRVDERSIFVDPVIYHENNKTRITTIESLLNSLIRTKAAIISGSDRSGKSLLTKHIQVAFDERGQPTVRVDGKQIANADVSAHILRATKAQYGDELPLASTIALIVDDFDECQLQDTIKEKIVSELVKSYGSVILTSFTHAPAVLFTPSDKPDPDLYEISPIGEERLLELVKKWRSLGRDQIQDDKVDLATFELLRKIFSQTDVEKYPGSAISFLQLIDSSTGNDITSSSYAACYETLITSHITRLRPNWQNLDEARNFISYLAFQGYLESHSPNITEEALNTCLNHYKNNYFSSVKDLREVVTKGFLSETDGGYRFKEEYEWYFLCARHAANFLKSGQEYDNFVMECTENIFSKQYANMVIFMAYFSTDNIILEMLLEILDGLFNKAPSWTISDQQKALMLGLSSADQLSIQSSTDVSSNRAQILREKVTNIIDEAENVVAQYTLPFLNPDIDDSKFVNSMDTGAIDQDSYMNSLNALMRVHSVIGQILASRSGTFDSKTMLDCITRMVQASGRYIALNHAISAVLVYDRQGSLDEVDRAYDSPGLSKEEKLEKVERIFSFWSVYLSQVGLARYLSHDHAIRALKMLAGKYENADIHKNGNIPFNFTSVLILASLYKNSSLERDLFDKAIEKYGDKSALVPILRVAVHFYSYYMPLSIQDKQWLGAKLKMPVKKIEAQRRQAVFSGHSLPAPSSNKPKKIRKKHRPPLRKK